uniref:Uncharacterized protein n=1 Tax=Arundo donax TaxID=35708 RepID=A0A0A9D6N3_ARUDO
MQPRQVSPDRNPHLANLPRVVSLPCEVPHSPPSKQLFPTHIAHIIIVPPISFIHSSASSRIYTSINIKGFCKTCVRFQKSKVTLMW